MVCQILARSYSSLMSESHEDLRETEDSRLAALEARIADIEQAEPRSPKVDRILRYLPFVAFGNMFLAVPAVLISLAVAYFAFQQAKATEKMQIAAVWPIVGYDTGNLSEDGEPLLTMNLSNSGVGPARIRGMEVSYEGRAYREIRDLVRDCCAERGDTIALVMSAINGEVLKAGEDLSFVQLAPGQTTPRVYERFEATRLSIRVRACYCSVFDDCWIEDSASVAQVAVATCPVDWVQFGFPEGVAPAG